jgi:hypothetical protein
MSPSFAQRDQLARPFRQFLPVARSVPRTGATLTITARGGEIAFGALEAGLEVEYARDSIGFNWAGCEEGDEVEGEGTAELLDDGTIEIEFAYRNGDEAVLKAKRDPSSTPC